MKRRSFLELLFIFPFFRRILRPEPPKPELPEHLRKKLEELFARDAKFYERIQKEPIVRLSARDMRFPLQLRPGGKYKET